MIFMNFNTHTLFTSEFTIHPEISSNVSVVYVPVKLRGSILVQSTGSDDTSGYS